MYKPPKFANLATVMNTDNAEVAITFAQELDLIAEEFTLRSIVLNDNVIDPELEDANMTIDGTYLITAEGFRDLCGILKIPNKFADVIPVDLLYHNIKRLIGEDIPLPDTKILRRIDNVVATVVKEPYKEIGYPDIISTFAANEIINISISERLLKIEYKVSGIDPISINDDKYDLTVSIISSLTKSFKMYAVVGMSQSVNKASTLLPFLGKVPGNYNIKDDQTRLLRLSDSTDFILDVDAYENLKENAIHMQEDMLSKSEAMNTFKALAELVGTADTETALGMGEELRDLYKSEVKLYTAALRKSKLLGLNAPELEMSEFKAITFMNSIAKLSLNTTGDTLVSLGNLSGRILFNSLVRQSMP